MKSCIINRPSRWSSIQAKRATASRVQRLVLYRAPPPSVSFYDATREFVASPGVYYTGKAIILFTLFYTSMNWYMYKRVREEASKKDEEE